MWPTCMALWQLIAPQASQDVSLEGLYGLLVLGMRLSSNTSIKTHLELLLGSLSTLRPYKIKKKKQEVCENIRNMKRRDKLDQHVQI